MIEFRRETISASAMAAVWRERELVYFRCRCTDLRERERWHPHQGAAALAGERWIWWMWERGGGAVPMWVGSVAEMLPQPGWMWTRVGAG